MSMSMLMLSETRPIASEMVSDQNRVDPDWTEMIVSCLSLRDLDPYLLSRSRLKDLSQ